METVHTISREKELLAICKLYEGEHLPAHHPDTSWAKTYSNAFVKASAELYLIYRQETNYPEYKMSQACIAAGIKSCKGSVMTVDRVRYLLKRRVIPYLKEIS